MSAIDQLKNAPIGASDEPSPLMAQYRAALLQNERDQRGVNTRLLESLDKTPRDFGADLDILRSYRELLARKKNFELNRRSLEDGKRQLANATSDAKRAAAEMLIRVSERRIVGEEHVDAQIAKLVSTHEFLRGWRLPL